MNELLFRRIKKITNGYDKKYRKNINEKLSYIVRTKLDITNCKPSAFAGAIIYLVLEETEEGIDGRQVVKFINLAGYSLAIATLYRAIAYIRKNLKGANNGERK